MYELLGWYTLWLVNGDSLLQHLRQSFGFARAESSKHVEHVNPYYTALFDILKQGTVFYEVSGVVAQIGVFEKMLTGSLLLSFCRFSLVRFFTARSFFFFNFAPLRWPRAWHRLLYSYFERNMDSANKFNRKQCDVMMTPHHVIVSIKLCLDVENDEYIILVHSSRHAGLHLTLTTVTWLLWWSHVPYQIMYRSVHRQKATICTECCCFPQ